MNRLRNLRVLTVWVGAAFTIGLVDLGKGAAQTLTPFLEQFSVDHRLKLLAQQSRTVKDWRVDESRFRALSGTVQVSSVVPRWGGDAPVRSMLTYQFVSPRDDAAAIDMIKAFALSDAVNALTSTHLNACLEAARTMKAPQVKTMLWRKEASGRLLKVYCGVTARAEYVVLDDRDLTSGYWKVVRP